MIKYLLILTMFLVTLFFLGAEFETIVTSKDKVFKPKLTKIIKGKGWKVVNRNVSLISEDGKKGIRFDEKEGVGVAWLEDHKFKNGTIEFDVKGKNVLQKSFVGIAFQAIDETNYDAVYFRPFNFKSEDPERRSHAVQYIASPDYGWKKLRDEFPGKYEQPVEPAPNPDEWVHARIVIDGKKVSVFVNDAAEPSLTVEKLTASREGKIGLWIGDNSDGAFSNLKITTTKR